MVLLVACATSTSAFAQDKKIAQALSAAADDYDMVMLEDAESRLVDAAKYAERKGLKGPQVAKVHIMLGIVRFARDRDEQLTELAFIDAVEAHRGAAIDPIYETPELSRIMESARLKAKPSDSGSNNGNSGDNDPGPPPDVADGELKHDPVRKTKAGEDLSLEAYVPRTMPVFRMFAHWRRFGEQEFSKLEMSPSDAVRFVGVIPGKKVRTSQIEYYIEALDRGGSVIATFASSDDPHSLLVTGSAGMADVSDDVVIPDPPDEDGEKGAGNVYFVLGAGSGVGLLTGGSIPTANTDRDVSAGVAPAFGHGLLDLGWIINESMRLGLYFRYQFSPTQDFSQLSNIQDGSFPSTNEECLGLGLPGDCLLGLRYRYFFAGGQKAKSPKFYSSVGLGVGRVRNWVRIKERWESPACQTGDKTQFTDPVEGDFCFLGDTVRTGFGHFSAGAGMNYPLAKNIDFVADATLFILTLDQTSFNIDANLGIAFGF